MLWWPVPMAAVGACGAAAALPLSQRAPSWQIHGGLWRAAHAAGRGRWTWPGEDGGTRTPKGPGKTLPPALSSPHCGIPARFAEPQHWQSFDAAGMLQLPAARKGFCPSLQGAGGCRDPPLLESWRYLSAGAMFVPSPVQVSSPKVTGLSNTYFSAK